MGSRGAFLESGGFSTPAQWHTVDFVDGIKVLERKDPKASKSLPERSNTPGTSYLLLNPDGTFKQLRVFGEDRKPILDIDYGPHRGMVSLHAHKYENGERISGDSVIIIKKGDHLYEKYKRLFKGVKM